MNLINRMIVLFLRDKENISINQWNISVKSLLSVSEMQSRTGGFHQDYSWTPSSQCLEEDHTGERDVCLCEQTSHKQKKKKMVKRLVSLNKQKTKIVLKQGCHIKQLMPDKFKG